MPNHFTPRSKLITVPLLATVKNVIDQVQTLSLLDQSTSGRGQTHGAFDRVQENLKNWFLPSVDLRDFSYIYPTSGISQGIECWLSHESRTINWVNGDYIWPHFIRPHLQRLNHWSDFESGVLYLSQPSAIDGNMMTDWDDFLNASIPHVVDLAFWGTVQAQNLKLSKHTEMVFYSFSKGFGLHSLRLGWIFSKKEIPHLEQLKLVGYQSLVNLIFTEKIISQLSFDFMYKTFQNEQKMICEDFKITPADSVLFANSKNIEFDEFKRNPRALARIPLSEILRKLSHES